LAAASLARRSLRFIAKSPGSDSRGADRPVQRFTEGSGSIGRCADSPYGVPAATTRASLRGIPLPLFVSAGGLSSVRNLHPFRMGRSFGVVVVVPVPPFVGRRLRVTLGRVLPHLLATERRDIQIAPDGPHRLVAAVIDKIGAEDPLPVA